MEKYNVFDCSIIELDKHHSDSKGNLTVVQNGDTLPFDVKRVYYLYDVPGGEERGSHAHRDLSQLIIAASGSFTVTLNFFPQSTISRFICKTRNVERFRRFFFWSSLHGFSF